MLNEEYNKLKDVYQELKKKIIEKISKRKPQFKIYF